MSAHIFSIFILDFNDAIFAGIDDILINIKTPVISQSQDMLV